MYIKMGFMRLSSSDQVELISLLFQSIPNRTAVHQETLLGLIVHALQHVKIVPNMTENVVKYGLTDQPTLRHLFLNFLLNVLLLTYKFVLKIMLLQRGNSRFRFDETKIRSSTSQPYINPSQDPVDEVLFSTMEDAPSKETEVFKQPFPCMTESLSNRITDAIQTDDLNQVEKVTEEKFFFRFE